jgi:hypothetical protein
MEYNGGGGSIVGGVLMAVQDWQETILLRSGIAIHQCSVSLTYCITEYRVQSTACRVRCTSGQQCAFPATLPTLLTAPR